MKNFLIAAVFAATSIAALSLAQTLPAGPGKEVFEKACTACHGLDPITSTKDTKEGWADTVEDMIAKGADINDADKKTIIEYLAKAFPKDAKISAAPTKVNAKR